MEDRISRGAHVMADEAAYPGAMVALGADFEQVKASEHRINRINTLHSTLGGFRGVGTKHLQSYLTWFLWMRCYRDDREDAIVRQMDAQDCPGGVRDWSHVWPPYMEYWGMAA